MPVHARARAPPHRRREPTSARHWHALRSSHTHQRQQKPPGHCRHHHARACAGACAAGCTSPVTRSSWSWSPARTARRRPRWWSSTASTWRRPRLAPCTAPHPPHAPCTRMLQHSEACEGRTALATCIRCRVHALTGAGGSTAGRGSSNGSRVALHTHRSLLQRMRMCMHVQ